MLNHLVLKLKKLQENMYVEDVTTKKKYHDRVDFSNWECAQCGGRCTYDGKTTFPKKYIYS